LRDEFALRKRNALGKIDGIEVMVMFDLVPVPPAQAKRQTQSSAAFVFLAENPYRADVLLRGAGR
jgi:hypothetical protein